MNSTLTEAIIPNPVVYRPKTPLIDVVVGMSQAQFSRVQGGNAQGGSGGPAAASPAIANSCALVMDEGQILGICTEYDLVRLAAKNQSLRGLTVAEVMTPTVITWAVDQLTDGFVALQFMRQHRIRHLPILDRQGDLLGVVTPQSLRQVQQLLDLLQGRQIDEVMNPEVVQATPATPVLTIAQQMAEQRVSCVVVVDPATDGTVRPVGIITERDIVQFQSLELNLATLPAHKVMSVPLCGLQPQDSLWAAHQLMQEKRIRRLVITNSEGVLAGIVTQTSMLNIVSADEMPKTLAILQQRINQLEAEKLDLHRCRHLDLEQQVAQRTTELQDRADREQFLARFARQINQSLDLSVLLALAVKEVKQFLQCDRVVVYQFEDTLQGTVIAEAIEPAWHPTLGSHYQDVCFPKWLEADYLDGRQRIVDDIYQANLSACHIEFLESLQIKGYLIVPVVINQTLWGLLAAHHCTRPQPWASPNLELLDRLGTKLSTAIQQSQLYQQAQAEIKERQQTEAVLRNIVQGTASVTGDNFFEALVTHLATALNVRHALVTTRDRYQGHALAFYSDGQLRPAISYELEGLPCAITLRQQVYCCSDDLAQHFPDGRLAFLEAQSYFGLALLNTEGQAIGTLCMFDDQPITNQSQVEGILKIFAARAAAELERQQTINALKQLNQDLETRVMVRTSELSATNIALLESNVALLESQEKLRRSEELLRLTIDNAPIGIVTTDLEGRFLTVNQAFCTMLGYTADEIMGQTFTSLTHPPDQAAGLWGMEQLVAHNLNTFELEKYYLHHDGTLVNAIVRVAAVRDVAGQPLHFVAEIEDLRDRKRAEAERTRLLSILEASLNEIYMFDAVTLRFNYVNPGALSNLGYTLPQMQQMTPIDIKPNLSLAELEALVAPLRRRDIDKLNFETVHQRADGSCYPADVHLQLIERDHEHIFLAVILDITHRHQAEDQINRQLLAIETAVEGIAILQGDTYQYLNQAHIRLFGYDSVEDLLGQTWEVLYPEAEVARLRQEAFPVLTAQGHWQGESIGVRKDGSTFYLEVSLTLSGNNDLVCVCRDIDERKQAEANMHKALEAERELNDLKSRFVSMTSHEFRTPLGVIASSAGIIQDYGDRLDAAKQQKHLTRIQDSVSHMTQLLEDVLTLSRAEVGKLQLKMVPTALTDFCHKIVEELNFSAGEARIQVQVVNAPPALISFDQRLMRQILTNLLSNALKYSFPDRQILLQLIFQLESFAIVVQDQGIGIPPEDLKHLFQSFHRAKNVGNIPGTGLGLSIVKKLVELHQGQITCQSQINTGTTFNLCFPLQFANDHPHLLTPEMPPD